ncbi:threonine/serine dehydratase [Amycolatopsis sp. 195334CR]|uniref:threonine ammonia-lyase n=1 Tax=Amycolatopsis sp. 195334CR TaxID=2814588 RepID=UPI001A8CE0A3|nr:pyridoxal-phosphate dependent enzyme [Amycolatopsis sp. 195334CR]MBN6038605.1 pyridoxal-phosphate dependent enzyme [Amycolatopsis sp. 195334CR]
MALVTIDDIFDAAARIDGLVLRTPLVGNQRLSEEFGTRLLLKAENLQHAGSFKVRGALNALLTWQERGELPEGVVSFSAGNHAAAISYAGRRLGVRVIVAMPSDPVPSKVANVERFGGEIVRTDDLAGTLDELAEQHGFPILHPFDLPEVIAGQGTTGLELCADGPSPDLVLVPVGGGGLLSGVAAAVRKLAPSARVVGVEPATSNAMGQALAAGEVVRIGNPSATVADGLSAPFSGEHTLPHVQAYVDEVVEVDEDAIRAAWRELVESSKLLVEPASAVCLAALRTGVVEAPEGGVTVLVVSGGNADLSRLG